MFHHLECKGQSVGRVLYCLEVYCNSYHRLFENAQVGDGIVIYRQAIVATYDWIEGEDDWSEGDKPHFQFKDFDPYHPGLNKKFEEQQYFKRPFLDTPSDIHCINYVVQEVRKSLTFPEALAIKHVRDELKGEWNDITVEQQTALKIQRVIVRSSQNVFDKTRSFVWWRHLALCAIHLI